MASKTAKKPDNGLRKPAPLPKGARRVERPRFWAPAEAEPGERTVVGSVVEGVVSAIRHLDGWGKFKQSFDLLVLDQVSVDGETVGEKLAVKCIGNLGYQVSDSGLREELDTGVQNRVRIEYLGKSGPTDKRAQGRHEFDLVIYGEAP